MLEWERRESENSYSVSISYAVKEEFVESYYAVMLKYVCFSGLIKFSIIYSFEI